MWRTEEEEEDGQGQCRELLAHLVRLPLLDAVAREEEEEAMTALLTVEYMQSAGSVGRGMFRWRESGATELTLMRPAANVADARESTGPTRSRRPSSVALLGGSDIVEEEEEEQEADEQQQEEGARHADTPVLLSGLSLWDAALVVTENVELIHILGQATLSSWSASAEMDEKQRRKCLLQAWHVFLRYNARLSAELVRDLHGLCVRHCPDDKWMRQVSLRGVLESRAPLTSALLQTILECFPVAVQSAGRFGEPFVHLLVRDRTDLTADLLRPLLLEIVPTATLERTRGEEAESLLHAGCQNPGLPADALELLLFTCPEGEFMRPGAQRYLPLHMVVAHRRDFSSRVVEALRAQIERYPDSVRQATSHGDYPLHLAVANRHMSVPMIRMLVEAYPAAAALANEAKRVPFTLIWHALPPDQRRETVSLLMHAVDDVVAREEQELQEAKATAPAAKSAPNKQQQNGAAHSLGHAAPPRPASWTSRLSRQGRVLAGLHCAMRGELRVWRFQTGGLPAARLTPGEAISCGHLGLLRHFVAASSSGSKASDSDSVLRAEVPSQLEMAMQHGHAAMVREIVSAKEFAALMRNEACLQAMAPVIAAVLRAGDHALAELVLVALRSARGPPFKKSIAHTVRMVSVVGALEAGDLAAVRTFYGENQDAIGHAEVPDLMLSAVRGGNVAALEWAFSHVWDAFPPQNALSWGWGERATMQAAKRGHLGMVEYLLANKCGGGPAYASALGAGQTAIYRLLHCKVPPDSCFLSQPAITAAKNGELEALQFLHRQHNITFAPTTLERAVLSWSSNRLTIVEYLVGRGLCQVKAPACLNACRAVNYDTQLLHYMIRHASNPVLEVTQQRAVREWQKESEEIHTRLRDAIVACGRELLEVGARGRARDRGRGRGRGRGGSSGRSRQRVRIADDAASAGSKDRDEDGVQEGTQRNGKAPIPAASFHHAVRYTQL